MKIFTLFMRMLVMLSIVSLASSLNISSQAVIFDQKIWIVFLLGTLLLMVSGLPSNSRSGWLLPSATLSLALCFIGWIVADSLPSNTFKIVLTVHQWITGPYLIVLLFYYAVRKPTTGEPVAVDAMHWFHKLIYIVIMVIIFFGAIYISAFAEIIWRESLWIDFISLMGFGIIGLTVASISLREGWSIVIPSAIVACGVYFFGWVAATILPNIVLDLIIDSFSHEDSLSMKLIVSYISLSVIYYSLKDRIKFPNTSPTISN